MTDSRPGRLVGGRYLLLRMIGQGGMGAVWAARDQTLDRTVAVKELVPPRRLDERERQQAQQRVLREARAAGGVASVAAVSVYDVLAENEHSWIVMELLEGPTLADVVHNSGPLSVADTIAIGESLIDALEAAHRVGVLHRDVKPANVLLTKRGAVLTDFGIAHRDGDPGITTTGVVFGSPSYLAPERVRGESAGRPADLWALGATLYTAVEGHGPFDREEQLAALHAVVNEPVPDPQRAGVLAPLLLRLLSKDPTQRPTVDQTRQLLARASRGERTGTVAMTVLGTAPAGVPAAEARTPDAADQRQTQTVERAAEVNELPQPPLRPRSSASKRLPITGLALLLVTVLAVALATLLPDPGGLNGEATDPATGPGVAVRSDSGDPHNDPDNSAGAEGTSVPAPFQRRALYNFARYLFDPRDCIVPSPGQFPVAEVEPDVELVKCVSTSAPYTGTFWCKEDLDGLLADRAVYVSRAVDGTQPITGPPAGQTKPEDGIQVAFNHVGGNDARVYWDSEKRLCAGELQAADSDDVDATVAYWLNGKS